MSIRGTRGIALLGVCALWACSKGSEKADSAALADSAAKAAAAAPPPAPTPPPLTDANIAALLDEANAGDSTIAAIAVVKGTAGSVKTFARTMMRDHHALRKAGQDLAKKLSLTAAPPANDTLPAGVQKAADNLKAMPKGADWDKAYISGEVAAHQAVLALLQTAQGAATDTSLKALIVKATPTIDAHLKNAQDIATKLNSAPAAPAPGDTSKKKP
jgi:putative membrane protein